MSTKTIINKKMAAGAALVALSGFVPQPLVGTAEAASAKIDVSGSFITGIKLAAGQDVKFGSLAATDVNGTAKIVTAGTVTLTKGVAVGGAPQAGSFVFTAVSTTPNVDITVAGLGAVVLAASVGGGGPTGTVTLNKIILKGAGIDETLTDGGGGTAKKAGEAISAKTGPIKVGAIVGWGGTQPIGSFTQEITLTIGY